MYKYKIFISYQCFNVISCIHCYQYVTLIVLLSISPSLRKGGAGRSCTTPYTVQFRKPHGASRHSLRKPTIFSLSLHGIFIITLNSVELSTSVGVQSFGPAHGKDFCCEQQIWKDVWHWFKFNFQCSILTCNHWLYTLKLAIDNWYVWDIFK